MSEGNNEAPPTTNNEAPPTTNNEAPPTTKNEAPPTINTFQLPAASPPTLVFGAQTTQAGFGAKTTVGTGYGTIMSPTFSNTSPVFSSTMSPVFSSTTPAFSSKATPVFSSTTPVFSSKATPVFSNTSPILSSATPAYYSKAPVLSNTMPILSSTTSVFSSMTPVFSTTSVFSSMSPVFTTTALSSTKPIFSSTASPVFSNTSPSKSSTTSAYSSKAPVFSSMMPVFSSMTPVFSSMTPVFSTTPVFSSATPVFSTTPVFSSTTPVFSTTPAFSSRSPVISTAPLFTTPAYSSTSPVFATPLPIVTTTSSSVPSSALPPSFLQAKKCPERFPGSSLSDSKKGKPSTPITLTTTAAVTTSSFSVCSTDTGVPSRVKSQSNPFSTLSSSNLVSSSPQPSTGANVFGGGLTHPFPQASSLFGGTLKSSKTESSSQQLEKTEPPIASNSPAPSQHTENEASLATSTTSASTTSDLFKVARNAGSEKSSSQSASSNIFGGPPKPTALPSLFGGGGVVVPPVGSFRSSVQAKGSMEGKRDASRKSRLPKPVSSADLAPVRSTTRSGDKRPSGSRSSSGYRLYGRSQKVDHTTSTVTMKSAKASIFGAHIKGKDEVTETKESSSHKLELSPVASRVKGEPVSPTESSPGDSKKNLTKVIVSYIPESCMEKDILRAHFSKYGIIKRLTLNTKGMQATIQYTNHAEASKAKRKGKKIHPKLPEVKIYYGTPARRKSEDGSNEAMMSKKKAIRTLQQVHQPSDLDPYTPLHRPGVEPPSQTSRLVVSRIKPTKSTASQELRKTVAKRKQPRVKAAAAAAAVKSKDSIIDSDDIKVIMESQAHSNNDKYLILKARDKFVRKKFQRTSDLNKATYLSATCPDMCPELERYMRDVQYDLSSFEMTDEVLDHRLVTKRFSRSSADKEEPLPYELRPGPVLLRTMDFLICNVINRGDEEGVEVDVWYNYLWNRTRAVRNDLMQQQLIDSLAVVIMERCTRFHIYSAARLCEEPLDLFDARMNTEHLTKSLQTLKELYHDLAENGQYFDTESEFRAYEMLLSLNDGERIVNQYSQFREEVQKSCQVQFSLKVILSVMFNNYTKFFKLIRQATFLQGCLLHRYFRQVRAKALDTIIRAYKGKEPMPLVTVVSMLGFEHEGDAASYLKCHGLNVESHNVILDKHSFIVHPDELPVLVRPMQMVEVKRTRSVSEVIQGGLMPNNPLFTHFTQNSFDDQGYLKPESKDASDQQCTKTVMVAEVMPIPTITKPEAQQNYQLLAHMRDVYHMVESIVIGEMVSVICSEVVEKYRYDIAIQQLLRAISHELMEENLTREVRQLSHEGYLEVEEEEREKIRRLKEAEERERRIMEETRESVTLSIHKSYNDQFVQELIVNVCQEAVSEVESELIMKELVEEIPKSYLEEVLLEETVKICRSAFDTLFVEQELKIKELQERIVHRKMGEIFQVWQKQTQMSRRHKRSQETFPAACSQLTVKQQNEALGWGYQRKPTEDMTVLQLSKLKSNLSMYVEKVSVRMQLARECAWLPLPLQNILVEEVDQISPVSPNIIKQYFKVLVCWSSLANPTIKHWLRAKLGHKEKENLEKPLNNCIKVVSRKSGVEYGWALTETSVDTLVSNETLHGASLVIFISSDMGTSDPQFQKFTQVMAEYPRVLYQHIFYDCVKGTRDGWTLMEEDLLKPEISEKLQSLLFESWRQNSILIEVVSSHLNSFVSGFVARKYVEPTLKSHSERTADGKSPMSPSALIDLFNSVITFLVEVIKSKDVINLDWPPPELTNLNQAPPLTWNKVDLMYVSELLSVLKLPELHVEGVISWTNITKAINSYAVKVCGHKGDATGLISRLATILSNTRKILEPVYGYDDIDFADCELHALQLPWTELVYACVSHKLADLPDSPVYYEPGRMECFVFPRTWWAAYDTSDAQWAQVVREPWTLGSRKRKAERQDQLWTNQTKVKKLPSKLLADIEVEKQKYAELDKKLEDLLEIDEELKYLFGETN